jgi:class 3 adenylate cyclase/pimeloyl-ACP methyl ester carboxylesterase
MPETRFVRSGDVDLAYQVFGSGSRNLLAVAGWVSHLEVIWELPEFARFLERLGELGRVVMYDKRGSGMSDRPPGMSPLEDHAADVRAVLDAAGMETVTCIGWVDAVAVLVAFAATWPERVDALVLGSFVATPSETVAPEVRAAFTESILEGWGEARTVPLMVPSVAHDERVLAWFRRYERLSATPNVAAAMQDWSLSLDIDDLLAAVQVPTLVLHRTDIATLPVEEVRRAAALVPGAKYVELPGADLYPIFGDCDAVVAEIEEFLTGTRSAPQLDRVLATVLFTDIVNSTARAAELGDRSWRDLLAAHHTEIRRLLAQFGGVEVNTTGDGFLATFDGPARAVRCAVAITEAVRALGIEIRAGIHTGEIERAPDDVSGVAVHVGARVAALAGASEVLVTSTVKDLVLGSGLEFDERGVHPLKGVPGDWHLYAVRHP